MMLAGMEETQVHECIICTQEMHSGIAALSCGHVFHRSCVEQWLKAPLSHHRCPLCKTTISQSRGVIPLYFNSRPMLQMDDEVKKNITECVDRDELVKMNLLLKVNSDHQDKLLKDQRDKISSLNASIEEMKEEVENLVYTNSATERAFKKSEDKANRLEYELSKESQEHRTTMQVLQQYKLQVDGEKYRKNPSSLLTTNRLEQFAVYDRKELENLVKTQHLAANLHKREYEKVVKEKRGLLNEVRSLQAQKHRLERELNAGFTSTDHRVSSNKKRKRPRGGGSQNVNTSNVFSSGSSSNSFATKKNNNSKKNHGSLRSNMQQRKQRHAPRILQTNRVQAKSSKKSNSGWQSQHGLLGGNGKKPNNGGDAKYIVSGYDEFGRLREFRRGA